MQRAVLVSMCKLIDMTCSSSSLLGSRGKIPILSSVFLNKKCTFTEVWVFIYFYFFGCFLVFAFIPCYVFTLSAFSIYQAFTPMISTIGFPYWSGMVLFSVQDYTEVFWLFFFLSILRLMFCLQHLNICFFLMISIIFFSFLLFLFNFFKEIV